MGEYLYFSLCLKNSCRVYCIHRWVGEPAGHHSRRILCPPPAQEVSSSLYRSLYLSHTLHSLLSSHCSLLLVTSSPLPSTSTPLLTPPLHTHSPPHPLFSTPPPLLTPSPPIPFSPHPLRSSPPPLHTPSPHTHVTQGSVMMFSWTLMHW